MGIYAAWVWHKVEGEDDLDMLETLPDEKSVDCLVIRKGSKHIEHMVWNGHHEVWDDSDGDDFECEISDVEYWTPFPELPEELK